jgi:hypothetical protein
VDALRRDRDLDARLLADDACVIRLDPEGSDTCREEGSPK